MKAIDSGAHLAALMNLDKTTIPIDGGEKYNHLIFARSPYLLQHAENPVNWYEWGNTAFEKAHNENLPILLSIGYATCHWCHVMAHESFEDEDVAALLNRHFVCIKVDREERPDIDDYYMSAAQLLTGGGGWPLNVFMTPDKEPFFAMTYLPKRGRGGTGGFMDVLSKIAAFWMQKPDEIRQSSRSIIDMLDKHKMDPFVECAELSVLSPLAFEQLSSIYDKENGGFGSAPKFPMPINLSWLIEQGITGNSVAQEMAFNTLGKMRCGGIWDQLGGGLHRYAVDANWLTPHFEKMLYDQAMVSMVATEAFQANGKVKYLEMADSIFSFVENELTSADGVFFSALDADSEGEEGKYYVWSRDEIVSILGQDAEIFCSFYDVSTFGNFEGKTILNTPLDLETFCRNEGQDLEIVELLLAGCREKLLKYRVQRIRPLRDEKIITAWNGLMVAALAKAGVVSGKHAYIERADRAARFIMSKLRRPDGRLLRSYLGGKPSDIPAFLEDYAFLCHGLLELYEATLDKYWLDQSLILADEMIRLFLDKSCSRFSKSGFDAEQMPGKISLDHDGVIPSAFSMAARCLVRLGHIYDRADLLDFAHLLLTPALEESRISPIAHLASLQVLAMLENEPTRITFSGGYGQAGMFDLLNLIKSQPFHNLVLIYNEDSGPESTVSICAKGTCYSPASNLDELSAILLKLH